MGFLLSGPGLTLIALVIGAFSFQAWKIHFGHKKVEEGKQIVIEQSVSEGKKINVEIKKETSRIKPGTAASELLKRYCRDCKR